MKRIIKKLVQDINEVLNQNSIANEMDALIDYGEWSQSEPDFSDLIKRWKLDRETLMLYCDIAEKYATTFRLRMLVKRKDMPKKMSKYYTGCEFVYNPWEDRCQVLHCLFMAGQLQPETETTFCHN